MSRGREGRALLLSDVTDIAFAPCGEDAGYYRVGVVGYGMNRTVANASLLREVRTVEGSRLLFPDALKLMDADFVRMRELSITMFPLKYLREWVRASFPELTDRLSR